MADIDPGSIGSTVPGHYGADGTGVTLAETAIARAFNIQGDSARAPFVAEVRRLFDVALPVNPNTMTRSAGQSALWLGPKSWLLISKGDSSAPLPPQGEFAAQRDALNALGGALFDVSASRVAFTLSGVHAESVLAKACPLDLHPRAFPAGRCAQSLLGRVNALLCKTDEAPSFTVMVARSFARDVWRTLCVSAAPYGYEVVAAPGKPTEARSAGNPAA